MILCLVVAGVSSAGGSFVVVEPGRFVFSAVTGGDDPGSQTLTVYLYGEPTSWTITSSEPWLTVSDSAGTSSATVDVTVDASGVGVGTTMATLTFEAPGAQGSPLVVIPVTRTIFPGTCRGYFFAGEIVAADDACAAENSDDDPVHRQLQGDAGSVRRVRGWPKSV
jgi:hypothetical protein